MAAVAPLIAAHPIEIDPRPCVECGLTIDCHERIETTEGAEFYCDDFEREIFLRAADLVRRWEAVDKPAVKPTRRPPESYRPAASTVAAFKYVVSLNDSDYLARWLENHPADAPALFQMWGKRC